jgi:hypothetical protein
MTDAIAEGHAAAQELRLTETAFDKIRANALEGIINTAVGDREKREELYLIATTVDAVRRHLRSVMDTGQMEELVAARREKTEG